MPRHPITQLRRLYLAIRPHLPVPKVAGQGPGPPNELGTQAQRSRGRSAPNYGLPSPLVCAA